MAKRLSEETFVEKYSGMPWDGEKLAHTIVEKVQKDTDLYRAAIAFLAAMENFERVLDNVEYEQG